MNNTNSLMTVMKPKDTIKLDIVKLDKSETHPKEIILPEDGLYRYLQCCTQSFFGNTGTGIHGVPPWLGALSAEKFEF